MQQVKSNGEKEKNHVCNNLRSERNEMVQKLFWFYSDFHFEI